MKIGTIDFGERPLFLAPMEDVTDIGFRMLERLKADLEPYGQVEQFPKMEGRQMIMIIAPKKKK